MTKAMTDEQVQDYLDGWHPGWTWDGAGVGTLTYEDPAVQPVTFGKVPRIPAMFDFRLRPPEATVSLIDRDPDSDEA